MVSITRNKPSEVSINGHFFRIRGAVETFIASPHPQKIIPGDVGLETHPLVSAVVWRDGRGGIGKDTYDQSDPNRTWWSTCSKRHRGHTVLQRRTVTTAAAASTGAVGFINEIGTTVLASFGTAVHSYNNSIDSWGSSGRTLLAAVTDSVRCVLAGSDTLAVATTTAVDWTLDVATWNRNMTGIKFMAFWRELLWGINNAGQLYFTSDLAGSWVADAVLRLPAGSVTGLFVGPSMEAESGDSVLYAATTYGPYVLDSENTRFVEPKIQLPFHPQNGKGAREFRGAVYFPAGNAVIEYRPGFPAKLVGPDLDDGLPADRRGAITTMVKTHNDLIVGIDSTVGTTTTMNTFITVGINEHRGTVFATDSGYPTLLGWAGGSPPQGQGGWEVKWGSGNQGNAVQALFVSNMYSSYRLWWGAGGRIYYQALPTDIINPSQVTTTQYDASGTDETPWLAPDGNELKTALEVRLETRNPTSSESVVLAYATNYVESYTTLGTQTSAGETAYPFPDATTPTGISFRSIRFKRTFARGSTNTNTPDETKLTFLYYKPYSSLLGFRVTIDLTVPDVHGRSIREQRDNLDTILGTTTLMTFTKDETTTFYVVPQPSASAGQDRGVGRDESGLFQITLVEAR